MSPPSEPPWGPHGDFPAVLEAARNGDPDAQGRLLEAVRPLLKCQVRRRLEARKELGLCASDVVQEKFRKAVREIETF
jgi:hypothetical protein